MVVSFSSSSSPPPHSLIFSILVLSGLCSKGLHIYQHADSIPLYLLALFFPTFFIVETILFVAVCSLLLFTSGWYATAAAIASGCLA